MPRRESLKNLQREKNLFAGRIVVGAIICVLMSGGLLFRLSELQIQGHDYYTTRANDNRLRVVPVPPVRGLIYDRSGVVLAENRPAFGREITPEQVDDMPALLAQIGGLVPLTESDIQRFNDRVARTPRYRGVPLRTHLSMEEVARFQINRFDFKGVDVTASLTRRYPLGAAAAHVIGYVGGINEREMQEIDAAAYRGLSQIGKIGVEKSHEETLRGMPGAKIVEANAYGRPLRELDFQMGKGGKNLILTLDAEVQLVAHRALGELDGAVVAIDPRNGEVIALVSKPGYDPELFVNGIDTKTYRALLNNPKRPLYNRALQGTYPPGSTVKPFMALAGLEGLVTTPDDGVYCNGAMRLPGSKRKYRCWKRQGHGWMNMRSGVMQSCDIYFYQLAQALGIDRIHGFLDQFGLGQRTQVDLPREKAGLLPSREWKRKYRREPWYPGETLIVGIGQGAFTTTPMQLAQISARLAMRGGGFKPHLVLAQESSETGERRRIDPEPLPPISQARIDDWEYVVDAMEDVAHAARGTARAAFKDAPYVAAGKTGTAQVAAMSQDELRARKLEDTPFHLRDHALFVAFAPADDPRIAVAVIAEHAGGGGSNAAPIARQVIDQYLMGEVLYTPPDQPRPPAPARRSRPT